MEPFVFKENINGKKVTLAGVEHTKRFFNENQDFFREVMKEGEASLAMEVSPVGLDDWQKYKKWRYFFGRIAAMAKNNGKNIYVVDPSNISTQMLNDALPFIGAALGAHAAINGISNLAKKKTVTRRRLAKDFLKVCAGGYIAFNNTGVRLGASLLLGEETFLTVGPYDKFSVLSELDYRNASIAEGIDSLTKLENKNIISIHGMAHAGTVAHYLKNLSEREFALLKHSPTFGILGENTIRKYEFQEEVWKETEKIKY